MSAARPDRACGWNGSLRSYVHPEREGAPCPAHIRERLLALRAEAARRAAAQRSPGLIQISIEGERT